MQRLTKPTIAILTLLAIALPAQAAAQSGPKGQKHKKSVIVIKPQHKPVYKAPKVRRYRHSALPRAASFAVIAGISYAVIDNAYYRRSGDTYVYVEQPPVATVTAVTSPSPTTVAPVAASGPAAGTVVDGLPVETTAVTVNGASYYVDGSVWYAPIAGTHQFVVVAPQL
ncbi:hypothetical protein [Ferrimonas pelagia]|uniref:DUF1236 domain-containing protein n=1 Tax=Ferrimonas pelagia TaxID=1177826 RepID=A0ABP9FDR4_9GAMM